jgi:hypothetical protein
LFGRLKGGGVVKVVVIADEAGVKKLSFVYPEGPAQPWLERDIIGAAGARRSLNLVEPVRLLRGRRGTVAGPWLAYRATRWNSPERSIESVVRGQAPVSHYT